MISGIEPLGGAGHYDDRVTETGDGPTTPELSVELLRKLANVVRFRAYLALRAFGQMRLARSPSSAASPRAA